MAAKLSKGPGKRRVTMTRTAGGIQATAVDYVPLVVLDAYVADARTRWDDVQVGPLDDGPGGPDYLIPAHLED